MAKKRTRRKRHDTMVLKLVLLVAVVLVVFEGKLVMTMFSQHSAKTARTVTSDSKDADGGSKEKDGNTPKPASRTVSEAPIAGFPTLSASELSRVQSQENSSGGGEHPTVPDPNSPAIVPKTSEPVDDSYFSDAVFIGDSRMEGFRNASGITQGRFFTSVGMSLSGLISGDVITTENNEKITVAAAVSGGVYNKIYLMLGTNDLGEYDMDNFHDRFTSAAARLLELQPDAILYICSIIYVDEAQTVPVNGEYVNNTNVDKLNAVLLQICEEQGYHYLNLNEIFSDGNGSLIQGASSDGVHLYGKYCEQMLNYLKSHYIAADSGDSAKETEPEDTKDDSDSV